jgi:ribosomal protein L37AE/L43A
MAKTHRGKGIRNLVSHGRDTCPVCKRTAVKVVYEVTVKEKTIKVCKTCKASLAHGKFQAEAEALVASTPTPTPPQG